MNLCLRSNGRKKCAEITEQAITVLSSLLTHPNHEVYFDFLLKIYFIFFLYLFRFDHILIHLYIQY
jgi:hypothetical protein